jgi:hypothetical protein
LVWLLAAVTLACSDPISTGNTSGQKLDAGDSNVNVTFDSKTFVDGPSDTPMSLPDVDAAPNPGEFGAPCLSNADCSSTYCVDGPDGKVCSKTCVESCPDGWTCSQVQSGTDTAFICKPAFLRLCDPCLLNADCNEPGTSGNLCVSQGPLGSFCGVACNPNAAVCPDGYTCAAVTNPDDGKAVYQCTPASGAECKCSALAVDQKLGTECGYTNVYGKCKGQRVCEKSGLTACDAPVPAQEECNGKDDDCNGQVDEGVEGAKCKNTNVFGSCPGVATGCAVGKPTCEGPIPAKEQCNGLDDDCNGLTDDGICDDGNPCTKDSCSDAQTCKHDQTAQLFCDDGNACTIEDKCAAGGCVGGNIALCDDNNACTTDACDPGKGCTHAKAAAGATCEEDGNPCTADTCDGAGKCLHNAANVCSIAGVCVVAGTVNPADPCLVCNPLQSKTNWSAQNGLKCDDGDPCTLVDKCTSGVCKGKAMDCSAKNGLCATGTCQNGACVAVPKAGVCNDGDVCTTGDTCIDGVCKGAEKDCSAFGDNKCTVGQCQLGVCKSVPKLGGCDDGDPCTVNDSCAGGGCKGVPMDCSGLDSTCAKGVCAGGQCIGKAINTGVPCNDGNDCTTGDLCQAGQCTGAPKNCAGLNNACQEGVCQGGQCFAQPKQGGCSDGNACTVNDACNNGQCAGAPLDCSPFSSACGQSVCQNGQCTMPAGGGCVPGQKETKSCGNCGVSTRTCTSSCSWGAWSGCSGEGVCSPGQVGSQPCGNCGTQTRTCNSLCQWPSSWSTCSGQGACVPGTKATQDCGNCGTQSRTCTSSCNWPTWGSCGGQGVCAWENGTNYKCCGYHKWQYCSKSCQWFSCQPEPSSPWACP